MSFSRRDFVSSFLGLALADLVRGERPTHFPAKAKRVVQIFCPGGVSHLDTWDYKPELIKRSGQPLPGEEKVVTFQGANGNLMKSPWQFERKGQSGKWVAETLPHLGELVDQMAFIHSMTARSNTHGPACVQMNTGFIFDGFPAMGSWVSYALGRENDSLPSYVSIPDVRGIPPSGPPSILYLYHFR